MLNDIKELSPARVGDVCSVEDRSRLFNIADQQRGRKHLHAVFFTSEELRLFKPGNSCFHTGVVRRAVTLELLILFFFHNLAGRSDYLAVFARFAVESSNSFQDRCDFMARQTGARA